MKKQVCAFLIGVSLFAGGSMQVQAEKINPQDFIQQSYAGLQTVTSAHAATWGFGSEANWGVDLEAGKIKFIFADGRVAEADVQVVGTLAANGSFMWGWDHPSVKGKAAKHAKLLKKFGEKHKIADLVTQPVVISEQAAWEYTALAMRLGENNGAYRANAGGGTLLYMTFGKISLTKQAPK